MKERRVGVECTLHSIQILFIHKGLYRLPVPCLYTARAIVDDDV